MKIQCIYCDEEMYFQPLDEKDTFHTCFNNSCPFYKETGERETIIEDDLYRQKHSGTVEEWE